MKKLIPMLIGLCLGSVTHAASQSLNQIQDWRASGYAKIQDGTIVLSGKGYRFLESAAWVPIVPGTQYNLSAEVKNQSGKVEQCSINFSLADADKKPIPPYSVYTRKDTETTLTAEALPGSRLVKIKESAHWKPSGYLAFGAKPDFSDLPNRTVYEIASITQKDGFTEIALKQPLPAGYPAGTAVRQHYWGGLWLGSNAAAKNPGSEWQKISGEMNGLVSQGGVKRNQFWPGTVFFRIIIHYRGADDNSALEIRNVTLNSKTAGESIFL